MKNVFYGLLTILLVSCNILEKSQEDLTKRLKGTAWSHGDYYYKDSDGVYRRHNEKLESCVFGNLLRFDADSVFMEDVGIKCVSDSNKYWGKKYSYKLSSDNRSLDIFVPEKSLNYKVEAYNDNELNLSPKSDPNGVIFYKRYKEFK